VGLADGRWLLRSCFSLPAPRLALLYGENDVAGLPVRRRFHLEVDRLGAANGGSRHPHTAATLNGRERKTGRVLHVWFYRNTHTHTHAGTCNGYTQWQPQKPEKSCGGYVPQRRTLEAVPQQNRRRLNERRGKEREKARRSKKKKNTMANIEMDSVTSGWQGGEGGEER
jgi:hypothetical protein